MKMTAIIYSDIDDVLAMFSSRFIKEINKISNKKLEWNECISYDMESLVGLDKAAVDKILDKFVEEGKTASLEPIQFAAETLHKMINIGFTLKYITDRGIKLKSITIKWLKEHNFPDAEIIFCSSKNTKLDVLEKAMGNQSKENLFFIDDRLKYAIAAHEFANVILFDRPWNRRLELPVNVKRVSGWNEIFSHISAAFNTN